MDLIEKIFLGFQFNSEFYDKSTIETLLVDSVKEATREIKRSGLEYVTLKPQLINLQPSEAVTEGIISLINESSICLFEISDNNPNVMFELGNAFAKNKKLIFLKHRESTPTKQVPSDIIGKFICFYGGAEDPSLDEMRPKITKWIKDYVVDLYHKKSETWIRKIWDIKGDNLVIVSGSLFGLGHYEVEPHDADTLFDSTIGLVNLYPGVKVKRCYSIDFPEEYFQDTDLLVVGGPDSNKITESVLATLDSSFPFSYEEIEEPYDFILKDRHTKLQFKKEFEGEEKPENLKVDYGFFLKVPNPYSKNRNIIIISGIGAQGTLGCSHALPFGEDEFLYNYYQSNFSKLSNKRHFCFVTKACIRKRSIQGEIVEGTTYQLDQNTNRWEKL